MWCPVRRRRRPEPVRPGPTAGVRRRARARRRRHRCRRAAGRGARQRWQHTFTANDGRAWILKIGCCLMLAGRRRYPTTSFLAATVLAVTLTIGDYETGIVAIVFVIGAYAVGTDATTPRFVAALVAVAAAMGVVAWSEPPDLDRGRGRLDRGDRGGVRTDRSRHPARSRAPGRPHRRARARRRRRHTSSPAGGHHRTAPGRRGARRGHHPLHPHHHRAGRLRIGDRRPATRPRRRRCWRRSR